MATPRHSNAARRSRAKTHFSDEADALAFLLGARKGLRRTEEQVEMLVAAMTEGATVATTIDVWLRVRVVRERLLLLPTLVGAPASTERSAVRHIIDMSRECHRRLLPLVETPLPLPDEQGRAIAPAHAFARLLVDGPPEDLDRRALRPFLPMLRSELQMAVFMVDRACAAGKAGPPLRALEFEALIQLAGLRPAEEDFLNDPIGLASRKESVKKIMKKVRRKSEGLLKALAALQGAEKEPLPAR